MIDFHNFINSEFVKLFSSTVGEPDVNKVLSFLLRFSAKSLAMDSGVILACKDDDHCTAKYSALFNIPASFLEKVIKGGDAVITRVMSAKKQIIINGPEFEGTSGIFSDWSKLGLKTIVLLPILFRNNPVGVLLLASRDPDKELKNHEEDTSRFCAEVAGLVIQNTRAFSRIQRQNEELARAFAQIENQKKQLLETTRELSRSNMDLEQFAYIASHDLKAPLRAIKNLAEFIETGFLNNETDTALTNLVKLRNRISQMEHLLDGILSYSRVGRTKVDIVMTDTGALVKDIVEFIHLPKDFHVEIIPGMPCFETPKNFLERVFRNLLDNAVKHHNRTDGRIKVLSNDKGEYYEFAVSDDGPGIAPLFHKRVFELFLSLKPREEVEGSGVGLAIVKKIVELAGGTVSLESDEGKGATFRFSWPKRYTGPMNPEKK